MEEALAKRGGLALEAGPEAVTREDSAKVGAELEVVSPDLGVEPGEALCSTEEDVTPPPPLPLPPPPLLTVACRILLFSSLIILSLSSLHCLSLACLSFS